MSYPRIGKLNEVNGDFSVNFNWELIQNDAADAYYLIGPDEKTFHISNNYYSQLLKEDKIILYWSVTCFQTFFQEEKVDFEKINIPTSEVGGRLEINYYLVAKKDFILDPPKGEVDDFFLGRSSISRGAIISQDDRKEIIKPEIVHFGNSSSLLKYTLKPQQKEEFRVEFDSGDKYIWLFIRDKDFINKLKKSLNNKSTRNITINSFFGAILIEAIRQLSDDEDIAWKEDMKQMIGYDETRKDDYAEFQGAFEEYNEKIKPKESFLLNIMNEIDNIHNE